MSIKIKNIWRIWLDDGALSEWCHHINISHEDYRVKRWMLVNVKYRYQTPEGKLPQY